MMIEMNEMNKMWRRNAAGCCNSLYSHNSETQTQTNTRKEKKGRQHLRHFICLFVWSQEKITIKRKLSVALKQWMRLLFSIKID